MYLCVGLTDSDQTTHQAQYHPILIQLLLNCDWFADLCDIIFLGHIRRGPFELQEHRKNYIQ